MIIFVLSRDKCGTHRQLCDWAEAPVVQVWSYDRLFRARKLPRATYCFGDFDRLTGWDCELAALVFRRLRAAGARVLNDPACVSQRFELLARLHREGVNTFRVWRLVDDQTVDRFPVFLRTISQHRGVETGLLSSQDEVASAAKELIAKGIPEKEIMAVEYAAEELRPGLFRKRAAYRIGERIVACLSVHEQNWVVKTGGKGIAGDELYEEEYRFISANDVPDVLMRAFQIASIDYGRVDFSTVRGRTEIYEINTNPLIRRLKDHPSRRRFESDAAWRASFVEGLKAIDSPKGPPIEISDPQLQRQRRRDGYFIRSRSTR